MKIFRCQWRPSRWAGLVAAILLELMAGSSYLFGTYAPLLKDALNLTQAQVNLLSSIMNLGSYSVCVT